MGSRTRSNPTNASKKDDKTVSSKPTINALPASISNPPHVCILPKIISSDARLVTIRNPATGGPGRYLACPKNGIYEFTRVAYTKKQPRSWLLASDHGVDRVDQHVDGKDTGYVLEAPDLLVATSYDPLFLLLPVLAGGSDSTGQEYLAPSDYLAKLAEASTHLSQVFQFSSPGALESAMESRIVAVCDCLDMGEDKMYALSLPKLVKELVSKARAMIARGLPPSVEDRFIKQALNVPLLSIKREDSSISIAAENAAVGPESENSSADQSQETDASGTAIWSETTNASTISLGSSEGASTSLKNVPELLRLRVALDYLISSYISPSLGKQVEPLLLDSSVSSVNFEPLDKHLAYVDSLKKEAQALRSLSDNISRKRNAIEDDDEAVEKAEAKKRKKEEEDARKKNVSHGVKKLAKADTSGMKKLSNFFTKAPTKK